MGGRFCRELGFARHGASDRFYRFKVDPAGAVDRGSLGRNLLVSVDGLFRCFRHRPDLADRSGGAGLFYHREVSAADLRGNDNGFLQLEPVDLLRSNLTVPLAL